MSDFPRALFMSTNHYHHHIAANTWQSNQARQNNAQSYGLTHVDIYQPDASTHTFTAPEGFGITVHSNTDLVPEKINIHTLLIQFFHAKACDSFM